VLIHHINGNNSYNIESNLAVLCLVHASQADSGLKKGKLGAGKKLKPDAVREHKKRWERRIELQLQHPKKNLLRPNVEGRRELKRLQREALASTRRRPEDIGLFEQKVIEIDLLNDVSTDDKVDTFYELGLEVALNSDRGTAILIEYILWQLAAWDSPSIVSEIIEGRKARKLLRHIAVVLWDIGVNGVEYGRGKNVIRMIANAILEVKEKARMLNANNAVLACKEGLDNMLTAAHRDKRGHVVGLLENAVTTFPERCP